MSGDAFFVGSSYASSLNVVPLPMFPAWSQPILEALPFRALADVPYRIYCGHIPISESSAPILLCAIWAGALAWFGRWLLGRGTRALVIQGG